MSQTMTLPVPSPSLPFVVASVMASRIRSVFLPAMAPRASASQSRQEAP